MSLKYFPTVTIQGSFEIGRKTVVSYVIFTLLFGGEKKRILWASVGANKTPNPEVLPHKEVAHHMWLAISQYEHEHRIRVQRNGEEANGGGSLTFDITSPRTIRLWVSDNLTARYGFDSDVAETERMLREALPTCVVEKAQI